MSTTAEATGPALLRLTTPYVRTDLRTCIWQLANTLVPYCALWYLMYRSLAVSYWLTLLLAIPAAAFLMRAFIIFHDCGHGSFSASRRANDMIGMFTGFLTFTPFYAWRHDHAVHHATAGDLDRRGGGDVWTLTVEEYCNASRATRFAYRLFRFPPMMLGLGGIFIFLLIQRLPGQNGGRREHMSTYGLDAALVIFWIIMGVTIGIKAYVLIHLPIFLISTAAGIWMFYVQHQFDGVYWERHDRWNYYQAAMAGSSCYLLPRVLQWFTGNIGFHHIHHLNPRIPNYMLEKCFRENEPLQHAKILTLRSSLRSLRWRLWDEERRTLVGFDLN